MANSNTKAPFIGVKFYYGDRDDNRSYKQAIIRKTVDAQGNWVFQVIDKDGNIAEEAVCAGFDDATTDKDGKAKPRRYTSVNGYWALWFI